MLERTTALAVGVEEIDNQHKELFRRLGALAQAMAAGDARTEVGRLVPFLAQYVVDHFATEEHFMDRYGYPGSASHKLQHQLFIREMDGVRKQMDVGFSAAVVLGLHRKACDWLVNHIGRTDKLLGAFLQSKQAA